MYGYLFCLLVLCLEQSFIISAYPNPNLEKTVSCTTKYDNKGCTGNNKGGIRGTTFLLPPNTDPGIHWDTAYNTHVHWNTAYNTLPYN